MSAMKLSVKLPLSFGAVLLLLARAALFGSWEMNSQEQAAALEETAASMERMTATVKQTAANAKEANQLAIGVRNQR